MEGLYLQCPARGLNSFNISFFSKDEIEVRRVREVCMQNLSRSLHWFHQGDTCNFQKFEFWAGNEDEIITEAKRIACLLGIELQIKR